MAQNDSSENKNLGLSKNQIYGILGVLAALLIVLAIVWNVNQDDANNESANTEETQNQTENGNNNGQTGGNNGSVNGEGVSVEGNVTSRGVLNVSDNPPRGNYVLNGEDGRIYVQTVRNYGSLVGKQVVLSAEGSLDSFTFLDFKDAAIQDDAGDVGGAPDEARDVVFTGKLANSNSSKGNYTITSGNTVVYLQSVRDYSAWVGSDVTLQATGTLDSFTNAVLVK